jgi:hypothetical protein
MALFFGGLFVIALVDLHSVRPQPTIVMPNNIAISNV